jgi:hypothetical protein
MSDTRRIVTENYRWTAYMKLKGETWAHRKEEILNEFDGFVQSLQGVGVGYDIIVKVEGKVPRQLHSGHNIGETEPKIAREGSDA